MLTGHVVIYLAPHGADVTDMNDVRKRRPVFRLPDEIRAVFQFFRREVNRLLLRKTAV